MASPRRIFESRGGLVVVATTAVIAAGAAISSGIATGVFNNPPPACYVTAPTAGATLSNAATLAATCGASTATAFFLVNGTIVGNDVANPFALSWNSGSVANGTYSFAIQSCDATNTCVTSSAVSATVSNSVAAPTNTVAPVASGSTVVGLTLSCTTGTWTGDVSSGYTYQWKDGGGNITGATSATYVIASGENGANIHCSVTATGTGGSTSADSNTIGPVTNGGGLLANEWVSATGSDVGSACVRSGSVGAAPVAANACATPQKACSLASGGDVIGVMSGSYTVGFNVTCTPATTVTFENQPGGFVTFGPDSSIGGANITLQGDTVGHGVGFSLGMTTTTGTNIVENNINAYCVASSPYHLVSDGTNTWCNAAHNFSGTNETWNGGDSEDWAQCAITGCTKQGNNDKVSGGTNITIEHVTFKNAAWLMNAADHNEIWKLDGGSHINFIENKLLACQPPAGRGFGTNNGCDSAAIFQACGQPCVAANFITLIGNICDPGTGFGEKCFAWSQDPGGLTDYTLTMLYNTFTQPVSLCDITASNLCHAGDAVISGANITSVGNIGYRTGSCAGSEVASHNVWFRPDGNSAKCNGTDTALNLTAATTIWNSPYQTSFDDTVKMTALYATGENTYCPQASPDVLGTVRPTLTACDPGAIQH